MKIEDIILHKIFKLSSALWHFVLCRYDKNTPIIFVLFQQLCLFYNALICIKITILPILLKCRLAEKKHQNDNLTQVLYSE